MSEAERILKAEEEQTMSGSIFPILALDPIFQSSSPGLTTMEGRRVAIVTCMDPRVNPDLIRGFQPRTSLVIRNAGGVVTHDVIRSPVISNEFLGAREFIVVITQIVQCSSSRTRNFRRNLLEDTARRLGL